MLELPFARAALVVPKLRESHSSDSINILIASTSQRKLTATDGRADDVVARKSLVAKSQEKYFYWKTGE